MKEENLERIEAHKVLYEDLVLWITNQFEREIKDLLPSAKISISEWYAIAPRDLIKGATVCIEIKGWFDSATMNYLCDVLGSKEYFVQSYPLCRMQLNFKVSISNVAKAAMQCTGMWTPKYRKDEQKNK